MESLKIPLSGQVILAPRWQNHSIDMMTLRSLYNGKEIAFMLQWNDRFRDVEHQEPAETEEEDHDTYLSNERAEARRSMMLRDQVAVQFPVKQLEGPAKPYFLNGQRGQPVNIWLWKADLQEKTDGSSGSAVDELNASGISKQTKQPPAGRGVKSSARWNNGQWKLVMTRSLVTDDRKNDVQFTPGAMVPIAVNAWDGSNGEYGMQRAISSWYQVSLEARTPLSIYVYAVVIGIVVLGLELALMRKVRRSAMEK